jgi:hypothetical protein
MMITLKYLFEIGPGLLVCSIELKFLINIPPLSRYKLLAGRIPYIIRVKLNVSAPVLPPGHADYVATYLARGLYLLSELFRQVFDQILLQLSAGIATHELAHVDSPPLAVEIPN